MVSIATQDWKKAVQPYAQPSTRRSVVQAVTTIAGMVACEVAAVLLLPSPLAIPFVLLAAGFLVRIFILQHDCGHGSFLAHKGWQRAFGTLCGFLMMTPYEAWLRDHAMHHATTGNLEKRGTGDIPMLTVDEYAKSTPLARFGYRLLRNPLVLFGLGPTALFLFGQRFPRMFGKNLDPRVRRSVHLTNFAGFALFAAIVAVGGWQALFLVHLPAAIIACSFGVFLFYVQHQFERPSWRTGAAWNFTEASLDGSSYLKLHPVLQYFTGNIGMHHVHHLAPLVPNYNLQPCMEANPQLAPGAVLGLRDALRTTRLKLYDEADGTMIGFAEAEARIAARGQASGLTSTSSVSTTSM